MPRALLALALALSLGNPAVQSWTDALVQLVVSVAGSSQSPSDAGSQWTPNSVESDAGNKWDPNG